MRISFASKISNLEVSSRSRTNSPSLDLGLENFFKSWSLVLNSNFFQVLVLVSVSTITVLTTSLHYRCLSFHPERVHLSRLNKNCHIRRRLQLNRTYRIAGTVNFYRKDKSFYPRSEACIAASIFQLFPKKKKT